MKKLMVATTNAGKVREIAAILESTGIKVTSLLDLDEKIDVEETGSTFVENAVLKAKTIAKLLQVPVLADDSGLEVDALNGEPGVYSARYAGEGKNDEANIHKVLQRLEGVSLPNRSARFKCALAVYEPEQDKTIIVEGACEGIITEKPVGSNGFGYDPIFFIGKLGRTMAQLTKEEKNSISHRADALRKLQQTWTEIS
ncbi:XTP/dITP diphosphatase [Bacillus sp. HMF5848]|uniref:XTP/dITP diphosphatase n=1 Tax=Bacillus sp. HMF5848 TaxID=2495421 RepID=UPI000F7B568D|nr:XTP/dITP diphosphatase [Bacillus sp. HMF5848]RSK28065.1 XTP/dITP diphosphatase [Bacillus sp. HMF5848]